MDLLQANKRITMKSKTRDPQQDPHKREQNSNTNIGYDNVPKRAKDTKGKGVKAAERESVDITQKQKQQRISSH
jgi:hypothetical protein